MPMTADDIQGVVGILPSPCTPDGDRWDAVDTVPLAEVEKMTRASVNAGIDILMTTGTFGEAATLTWSEVQTLVDCVVQNRAGKPVFAGVTTLNTRDTIARARALVGIGATGLFVGRPMWLPLDQRQIVQYYRDIADALPGIPLVVYDNPHAFKGKILTGTYQELAKIPEVVASKHTGGPALEDDILAVRGALRILPLETGFQWPGSIRNSRARAGLETWRARRRRSACSDAPYSPPIGIRRSAYTKNATGPSKRCSPVAMSRSS
jgi:dihydrodipicolinate synthase/N-acetylneuraminate lyase